MTCVSVVVRVAGVLHEDVYPATNTYCSSSVVLPESIPPELDPPDSAPLQFPLSVGGFSGLVLVVPVFASPVVDPLEVLPDSVTHDSASIVPVFATGEVVIAPVSVLPELVPPEPKSPTPDPLQVATLSSGTIEPLLFVVPVFVIELFALS
jgi:hypothetical protein